MISTNPPAMGWVYADRHTYELKYGNKSASIDHVFGPWGMCEDDLGVDLEEKEAFVAVEVSSHFSLGWTGSCDGEGGGGYERKEE